MPYVTRQDRQKIGGVGFDIPGSALIIPDMVENGGDLNYAITTLCAEYIRKHGLSYSKISDVVGALEGAKQEFFRKVVNPYEEIKEKENGGIYY